MTSNYRNPEKMTDLERQLATPLGDIRTFEIDQLRARIEALTAERDAAVAYATRLAQSLVSQYYPGNTGWQPLPDLYGLLTQIDNATTGIAEFGEHRATAAIVAWLRAVDWCSETRAYAKSFADAIERGEHLPAKPAG
jgi:hypothetical protein